MLYIKVKKKPKYKNQNLLRGETSPSLQPAGREAARPRNAPPKTKTTVKINVNATVKTHIKVKITTNTIYISDFSE